MFAPKPRSSVGAQATNSRCHARNRGSVASMSACLFAASQACVFDSAATAAWLQAVFSIVAIAFAALIPVRMQHARAAHHRGALAILCRDAYAQICGAWQIAERQPDSESLELADPQMADLRASATELRAFPVVETDRPLVLSATRAIADHMEGAAVRLEDFLATNDPVALERLRNISQNCLPHLRRALVDLGVGLGDVPDGEVAERWPDHPIGQSKFVSFPVERRS